MNKWEDVFKQKLKLWGDEITSSAHYARDYFKKEKIKTVLVLGIGYGRNAKLFLEDNLIVDGIEISQTALTAAKEHNFNELYLGDISQMPFNQQKYDAVYSHALIHLLTFADRQHLIRESYNALKPGGTLILTTVVGNDAQIKNTILVAPNTYRNKAGIDVFIYDEELLRKELALFKKVDIKTINESTANNSSRFFYYVTATK